MSKKNERDLSFPLPIADSNCRDRNLVKNWVLVEKVNFAFDQDKIIRHPPSLFLYLRIIDGKVRLFGFLCMLPMQNVAVVERFLFKPVLWVCPALILTS